MTPGFRQRRLTAFSGCEFIRRRVAYFTLAAIARYDQASPLINAGKLDEAKALLSLPLEATSQELEGQVGQNAWLASLAYQQGNWEEAIQRSDTYIKSIESNREINILVKSHLNIITAQNILISRWKENSIISSPKILKINNGSELSVSLPRKIAIRTFKNVPLTATSDDARIKVQMQDINNEIFQGRQSLNRLYAEKQLVVEVNVGLNEADFDSMITVESPQIPNVKIRIPVHFSPARPQ